VTPIVSVGLPTFNGEAYVASALRSLLDQSLANIEIIVCDNASTDATEEIVRQIAADDQRVRYIRSARNIGASANHNLTFDHARSAYFHWHGHDDLCAPTYLEKCVAVLDREPDVVLCHSLSCPIDDSGRPLRYDATLGVMTDVDRTFSVPAPDPSYATDADPVVRFRDALWHSANCQHVMGVMRVDAMRRTRLLSSYYSADRAYLMSMALLGRFVEIPEMLFFKREHMRNSRRLKSAEEKAQFAAPEVPAWMGRLDHVRGYTEITRGVLRSDLTRAQKMRCLGIALSKVWASHLGAAKPQSFPAGLGLSETPGAGTPV
jgi:glycosyltransferase involved in cell wall biosynthesis